MIDLVWGVDLGGNRWHACGPNDELDHEFLNTAIVPANGGWKGSTPDERRARLCAQFGGWLVQVTNGFHPATEGVHPRRIHLFVEYPIALKNGHTTIMLSQMSGAMWHVAQDFDVFWHWVEISTWKKEIVKGNAGKPEIKEWCEAMGFTLPDDLTKKEGEDFYDTRCIREWGERALLLAEDVAQAGESPGGS